MIIISVDIGILFKSQLVDVLHELLVFPVHVIVAGVVSLILIQSNLKELDPELTLKPKVYVPEEVHNQPFEVSLVVPTEKFIEPYPVK